MSETAVKIPLTLEERLPLGEELLMDVDWDTFLDILEKAAYPVQYDEGQMRSFMGYRTEEHEALVGEIIRLLGNLMVESPYKIYGSNLALHLPGKDRKYYNADCTLVKGKPETVPLRGEMTAVSNPVLLVEVLSKSTYSFDLGKKFQRYKTIPSLEQVLYVDSLKQNIISYQRQDDEGTWLIKEFTADDALVPVLEFEGFKVIELYKALK